jgi:DNA replication protein
MPKPSNNPMHKNFTGFEDNEKHSTRIPDQFFSDLLPCIQNINDLKLILYLLWSAFTQGDYGTAFSVEDILFDEQFIKGLSIKEDEVKSLIKKSFEELAKANILIKVFDAAGEETCYFINSPRGRAAANLMRSGSLFQSEKYPKATLDVIKPNIFRLYEENIGPLTPLIADSLRDAQQTYPEEWIKEAIQIAVSNNVRRWNYIDRILSRWQEEGRNGTNRRDTQEDYKRYLKGEYGEFGRH